MINITRSINSRESSVINNILHELDSLFTINVTMRDIKSIIFFFKDTPTTKIYTLSLHDALPISVLFCLSNLKRTNELYNRDARLAIFLKRSEEHTSELQSHHDLVCRLLLEK